MQTFNELSDPDLSALVPVHDWCDGCCRRCPMRSECALSDLAVDAEAGASEPQPLHRALRHAALDYSFTLAELAYEASEEDDETVDEPDPIAVARHCAAVIGIKAERIANLLELEGDESFTSRESWEVHLNLLLIERLDESAVESAWFAAECLDIVPYDFLNAHDHLFELLAPLFQKIPDAARAQLAEMVRNIRAPSPFCTLEPNVEALLS